MAGVLTSLPFDVTQGNAKSSGQLNQGFFAHLKKGGVVIIPILFLGLICLLVVIFKIITLFRIGSMEKDKLDVVVDFIKNKDLKNAEAEIRKLGRPFSPVLLEGVYHHDNPSHHIEDIMHERVLAEIPYLEKWLSVLAVSAAASPLLGLLGTVTGMIHTFDLITIFGAGKANLLSAGISEALITTEFGLIIAIPSLIFHAFFSRRVKHIINNMDMISLAFINKIKAM